MAALVALLSALAALLRTEVATRRARLEREQLRQGVHDAKQAAGATQRAGDDPPSPPEGRPA